MDIVNALDKHYVAFGGLSRVEGWRHRWQPDPDGVLTKGPFSGRRVVWIRADSHGSYFRRAGFGQDTDQIRIQDDAAANVDGARKPDSPEDFVQRVAHETVHVFHRVREKPPKTGAPLADIVDRQVREEIQTREEERTILDEIGREVKKTDPVASKSLLKAAKNIETARGVVERDFVVIDGKQTTYLERFVLDHLIASSFPADESVRRRRRTFVDEVVLPETEEELAKIVAKRSFNGLRHSNGTKVVGSFLSDFEKHLLAERLIHQRWSSMKGPSNPARMEERLTEHAAFLFPRQRGQRRVSYSPLP
jgi:hypothetical protein